MPKSAQQKFNEYLNECHSTTDAVNAVVNSSNEFYKGYAFAAGFLGMILSDAISELPKARRADFRARLMKKADEINQQILIEKIKEPV